MLHVSHAFRVAVKAVWYTHSPRYTILLNRLSEISAKSCPSSPVLSLHSDIGNRSTLGCKRHCQGEPFDLHRGEGVLFCVAMGRTEIQDTLHDSGATGNRSVKSCGGYPIPLHLATHGPISHFWQPLKTCRDACLAMLGEGGGGVGGGVKAGWC